MQSPIHALFSLRHSGAPKGLPLSLQENPSSGSSQQSSGGISCTLSRPWPGSRCDDGQPYLWRALDGVQRVSSMVRHDLRGPLQTIMNAAYVSESNPQRTGEMMDIIMRSVKHQSDVMEDWKSQDLKETMNITETDLSQLIGDMLAASLIPTHIIVEANTGPMKVNLDKIKMRRVMDNLIRNATEAMADGGTLTITTSENKHG